MSSERISSRKNLIISAFAVSLTAFQIYTAAFGVFPNLIQRGIFLGFVLVLCFFVHPFRKKRPEGYQWLDFLLIVLSIVVAVYLVYHYDRIVQDPAGATWIDRGFGAILIVIVIEAARRVMGWNFPVLAILALSYALFGHYIPGNWGHRGFSYTYVLEHLFMTTQGIWGIVIAIGATIVAIFVVFGAVLQVTGGGEAFTNIGTFLSGRATGGAAKVGVFSSGLFGMTNGNGPANVATTGVFTIPLMKRRGYASHFAAAVEATASSGGQIMPPVMGASAFIMAELINIRYVNICIAAFFPALMYYIGCWASVHLESRKNNYLGLPRDQIPSLGHIISVPMLLTLVIPVIILVYLLFEDYTPLTAAFWGTFSSAMFYLVLAAVKGQGFGKALKNLLKAMDTAGRGLVFIGVLCAAAQIVVSMINLTGVGVKLSAMIMSLSGNYLLPSLLLTMVVVIILGMGLPTAAAYVLAAAVVGPALTKLGLPPLTAHLFILYFAVFSALTPPVCTSVYVASTIAESEWTKSAVMAMKIGIAGFLAPYIFCYAPGLILQAPIVDCVTEIITSWVGILFMAGGVIGFLRVRAHPIERILLILAGLLMIEPSTVTDVIGFAIGAGVYLRQRFWKVPSEVTEVEFGIK
jgi:TRAP transporter 4TM/12TM fusion protein